MKIERFKKNALGRDFVVGDIHGCFTLLHAALVKIGFDRFRDRLFACGDLIDRGPESEKFEEWLKYPWFFSVKGNHDVMAVNAVRYEDFDRDFHIRNGGIWMAGLPIVEQQCYAIALDELPDVIEIETSSGLVGIVHAEVPNNDWDVLRMMVANKRYHDELGQIIRWSRYNYRRNVIREVKNIHKVFCGHTVVDEPLHVDNVFYIDTGAVFDGRMDIDTGKIVNGRFTIVEI